MIFVLSCRVSKPHHETFGTRSFNNAVDHTAASETLPWQPTLSYIWHENAKVVVACVATTHLDAYKQDLVAGAEDQ